MKRSLKQSAVFSLLALGSLIASPVHAALIDYRIIYHQTHILIGDPSAGPTEDVAVFNGYFTIDTDQTVFQPGRTIDAVLGYTSKVGAVIYDNASMTLISSVRLVGGSQTTPPSADSIGHAQERRGSIFWNWGNAESNSTVNRRGVYELIRETSLPTDTVQNGLFPRTPCTELITCLGWSASGLGTVDTVEWIQGTGNYAAQLTTGSEAVLSQSIDIPSNPFQLDFDYMFTTPTGTLDVILGSTLLGTINATPSSDFANLTFFVDDPSLLGQTGQNLSFHLNGLTGSQVLLDNVVAAVIPLPPAAWLFGSGLLGLVGIARRKKAA